MKTKLLLSLVLALLVHSFGFGATISSAQSGDWNIGTTWVGGAVPGSSDDVKITAAHKITVANVSSCKTLYFENATLTVNSTLTVGGAITVDSSIGTSRNVVIDGLGTLNCGSFALGNLVTPSNANPTTVITSTVSNFSITGDLTILSSFSDTYTYTNNATFNFVEGIVTIGGQLKLTSNGVSTSTFVMASNVNPKYNTLILNYVGDPFVVAGTGTNSIVLNNDRNTVCYDGSGNQAIRSTPYYNLILAKAGEKIFPNVFIATRNRLTITGAAKANLGTGVTHTSRYLSLGSEQKTSVGLWGSDSSVAVNKNNTYFTANNGMVNIAGTTCVAPIVQDVTGENVDYCGTVSSTEIGLASSQAGVSYQLVNGTSNVGTAVAGTGSAIVFSAVTSPGIYTVIAYTSPYCPVPTLKMSGNVIINTYTKPPVPTANKTADAKCSRTGAIEVTTALSPASLAFQGGNYVATAPLLNNLSAFTVEGWVKFNTADVKDKIMSWFGQDDVIEFGLYNNKIRVWTFGGGNFDSEYPIADIGDNNWHYVTATGDGTKISLYIDGKIDQSGGTTTSNYGTSAKNVTIGSKVFNGTSDNFKGEIFKVGFWNRALTDDEINSLSGGFIQYNVNQTGLLAGYNFTEATGTSLAAVGSASGTATGTLTGSPVRTDPYTYAWTGPNGFTSSDKNLTALAYGDYSLTTSFKNCSSTIAAAVNVPYVAPVTAIWNGDRWFTTPTIEDNLVFEGDYNVTTDLKACSCTVNSGAVVVNAGNTMTIVNEVKVNGGSLTFEDKSSLVQITRVTTNANTGDITYKRNTSLKKFDYTFWSSPVTSTKKMNEFSPNTVSDGFQMFDNDAWAFVGGTSVMSAGVGFAVMAPQSYTETAQTFIGSFTGIPNNGDISIQQKGTWKLIGNPYPSALDVEKFITENATLYGTVYFWTHNTSPNEINEGAYKYNYSSVDYASFNSTGGTSTDGNEGDPVGFIGAGQSFFIAGWDDTVFFNNTMRAGATTNNDIFYKTSQKVKSTQAEKTKNRVWLNLTNSGGLFKQVLIGYVEGATNNYDRLYDGVSFNNNKFANFYSLNNGTSLVIQGRALPFQTTDEVPLGFMINLAKTPAVESIFTISIDHTDGGLKDQAIYLFDKKTNITHDLRSSGYEFSSYDGTFNDRFVIKYNSASLGVNDVENTTNEFTVAVKNKIITIDAKAEKINKIIIYDLSGKIIYDKDKINNSEATISNLRISNEVVLLKIILENGKIQTKKVLFN